MYGKQPQTPQEIEDALARLRYHQLCERLESEETEWPKGDPLYMGLRNEASSAIRNLIGRAFRIIGLQK